MQSMMKLVLMGTELTFTMQVDSLSKKTPGLHVHNIGNLTHLTVTVFVISHMYSDEM